MRRGVLGVVLTIVAATGVALGVRAWLEGRTPAVPLTVPTAAGDAVRGRHLLDHVLACGACHGADLGGAWVDGGLVGRVWAPNLTSGVGGRERPALAWVRALRRGEDETGRVLALMPAARWAGLAESDMADVLAAVRELPPVDRPAPEPAGFAVGWWLGLAGRVVPTEPPPSVVEVRPDAEYGRYLATIAGCHDCHGAAFRGGDGTLGRAPGIVPRLEAPFAGARFADALLRGRGADGRALAPVMPWPFHAGLTDTEVDALWQRVRRLAGSEGADGVSVP